MVSLVWIKVFDSTFSQQEWIKLPEINCGRELGSAKGGGDKKKGPKDTQLHSQTWGRHHQKLSKMNDNSLHPRLAALTQQCFFTSRTACGRIYNMAVTEVGLNGSNVLPKLLLQQHVLQKWLNFTTEINGKGNVWPQPLCVHIHNLDSGPGTVQFRWVS